MLTADYRAQADASRHEHEVLDHLKSALRVTLDWNTPSVGLPRKMSSLQFVMRAFFRHLQRMMDLEEQDGYLVVVAEQNPNLDARIHRLHRDHELFRNQMRSLEPEMESVVHLEPREFDDMCRQVSSLLCDVDRHDADEIELLQHSFLMDEGGEG